MQALTVPYIVYALTKSNAWLGLAGTAVFLPSVLGTTFTSAIVDRYDRRRLLLVLQVVQMATSVALWAVWVAGLATPTNMIVLSAVGGFMGGMVGPAWNSFVPMLVPRELMASAIRLNAMQFEVGSGARPAARRRSARTVRPGGHALHQRRELRARASACSALHPRTIPAPVRGSSLWNQALDGWRYVLRNRSLAVVPVCMFVSGFFGSSIIQLASALAEEQFHRSRSSIRDPRRCVRRGSVVGSFAMSAVGDRMPRSVRP